MQAPAEASPPKPQSGLRKAVSSVGWMTITRMIGLGASLLVAVWLARHLGAEAFGVLNFAIALVWLISPFVRFGLEDVVVRQLVSEADTEEHILGSAFAIRAVGTVISVAALTGAALLLRDDAVGRWMIIIIGLGFLLQPIGVATQKYTADVNARPVAITNLTGIAISLTAKTSLILTDAPLIWFAIPAAWDIAASAGTGWVAYSISRKSLFRWRPRWGTMARLTVLAWPLAVATLMTEGLHRIDALMLGQMIGDTAVGIYGAASRLSDALYIIPTTLMGVLLPFTVRKLDQDDAAYIQRLTLVSTAMLWVAIGIAVPIVFLAPLIISTAFGPEYTQSAAVLQIHIFNFILTAQLLCRQKFNIARGDSRLIMAASIFVVVLNAGLNWALIPVYGPIGAAWASVAARLAAEVFIGVMSRANREFSVISVKSVYWPFIHGPAYLRSKLGR